MSDQNQDGSDTNGNEDAENEDGEYEVERLVTREDGAAALRRLADGVANGAVELGGDEDLIVTVPDRLELEIEYEEADEEAELEAELEWPLRDGEAIAAESEADEDGEDGEAADDEPEAADTDVDDIINVADTASNAQFELYRDRADEWRWRLVHDNGNIIADSGEGYNRKASARNGLESVMRNAPGADIVEDAD